MREGDTLPIRERYFEANKEKCWRLVLESSTVSNPASEGEAARVSVSAAGRREETERSCIVAVAVELGE